MFSGRGIRPWHGLSTVVDGMLTADAALEAAHLTWTVSRRGVYIHGPGGTDEEAGGYKAIARDDTGAVLGIMSDKYVPIQNSEAFEFFDSVVGAGQAVYDTAGALHGGRKVWILAKLLNRLFVNESHQRPTRPADPVRHFERWIEHAQDDACHDARGLPEHPQRLALRGAEIGVHPPPGKLQGSRVRSTAGAENQLRLLRQPRPADRGDEQGPDEPGRHAQLRREVVAHSGGTERSPDGKARAQIVELFSRGLGNSGRSKWDALNAVTEFVDHHRRYGKTAQGDSSETRFASTLFGSGAALKQQAVSLLN